MSLAEPHKSITPHPKRAAPFFQWFFSVTNIVLSIYLLIEHTRLITGIQESPSFCALAAFADCDIVNASPYSTVFGIPLATIGACFYFLILVLLILAQTNKNQKERFQRVIFQLLTLALVVDALLLLIQVLMLKTTCLFCALTYLGTIGLWISTFVATRHKDSSFVINIKRLLFSTEKLHTSPLPRPAPILAILGVAMFSLMVIFLPSYVRLSSQRDYLSDKSLSDFFVDWKNKPPRNIDASPMDGTFGNPDAKIRIVEFSDFECPHCRKAAFTLHAALATMKDKIYFVFKHFPLDTSCNSLLTTQMHPNACSLAQLATCAAKKGKFWQFHDHVFMALSESDIKAGLTHIRSTLSHIFTEEEIDTCLSSHESRDAVLDNIRLAREINVQATPSVYINGKLVLLRVTIENIRRLIAIEARGE